MNTRNRINRATERAKQAAPAVVAPDVPIAGELVSVEAMPGDAGQLYDLVGDHDLARMLLDVKTMWQRVKAGQRTMSDLCRLTIQYKLECRRRGHELPTYAHEPGEFEAILARLERMATISAGE